MADIDEFLKQVLADQEELTDRIETATAPDEGLEILSGKSPSLSEQCVSYEGKLIKRALELAHGNITEAAFLLTLTPEHLTVILELRHRDLLASAAHDQQARAELQYSPIIFHDAA
jgi:DNA-binding NtrC family response regulator